MKNIQEKLKHGEEVYYIKRKPGIPLTGGTVWTYESTGELRAERAVIACKLVVGLHIDEDGYLYFGNDRARLINGKPFLYQRGGNFGTSTPIYPHNTTPVTYTVMKTKPKDVRWLLRKALVPIEDVPNRPADLVPFGPLVRCIW